MVYRQQLKHLRETASLATSTAPSAVTGSIAFIDVSCDETIAVGDAENDQAFLHACGLAAAVDNALPMLKEMSDVARG